MGEPTRLRLVRSAELNARHSGPSSMICPVRTVPQSEQILSPRAKSCTIDEPPQSGHLLEILSSVSLLLTNLSVPRFEIDITYWSPFLKIGQIRWKQYLNFVTAPTVQHAAKLSYLNFVLKY